ncbi:MAG: DUF4968 domain-containing protein [Anaerolineae bacterium]|nr:DUF4968 domain-containing protein [Anaerolineae bacterium]
MPTLRNDVLNAIRIIGFDTALHTAVYRFRKAWLEARWERKNRRHWGIHQWYAFRRRLATPERPVWPDQWITPGRTRFIQPEARGATLITDHGLLEIVFFAPDLVRVRVMPHHTPPLEPLPYAIAKPLDDWDTPAFEIIQTPEALLLKTQSLTVGVNLADTSVFIADADDQLLRADVDTAWSISGAVRHRTALAADEHLFGLGERTTSGNRRGRTHILWNTDPQGYADGDDPINLNIPVYVGITNCESAHQRIGESRIENVESITCIPQPTTQNLSYLVFYENSYYAEFDLDSDGSGVADHRFAGGELRYYIAVGTVPTLLERYTELTGRHALPPLWLLGYHQSRWSYAPEARVRKLAQDFREYDVPCDAIHLDIDYMDGFRCFTWNKKRFPDLPQLAADLRLQGIKLISILDPGIKQDPAYAVYRNGVKGNHFCKTPAGNIYHAPVWPRLSAFPDFTAPATRAWWGELYRVLLDAGIAGFWNDMNEPAVFNNGGDPTLPAPIRHSLENRGSDHREAHNVYGMQMVRATYEGLRKLRPDRRPVTITRAGWAGVQRYATSWTGDNESTWESLRLTIPMMLGLGLSGVGFSGPDVGGFIGEADGELFTRWLQMAAFMPFFRAHTAARTADQEPWAYGEPYLSIARRFIQLRYELLPYLYTATWQLCERGWPVVRPLWWDVPHCADLWEVEDAFLCGDALLIAPVGYAGAVSRAVSMPPGTWYNFWTNEIESTSFVQSVEIFCPLETLPFFVRAGTVLPMGESGPNVEQRMQKFLRLGVYPLARPGNAVSELYEDAGEGFCYQQGVQRFSRFLMEQTAEQLILTWEGNGGYQPPYEHIELTLNGLRRAPRAVYADGVQYAVVTTDPVRHTALLGVPPFERLEVVM